MFLSRGDRDLRVAFQTHPGRQAQTEAVEVWGLTDNMSYRSYEYPLLFDASCNPKPAFWAVVNPDAEGGW